MNEREKFDAVSELIEILSKLKAKAVRKGEKVKIIDCAEHLIDKGYVRMRK